MGRSNYIINYVDDTGKEDFRLPQCRCGKLAEKYYEIADSNEISEESPYVVNILCKICFEKMIKKNIS